MGCFSQANSGCLQTLPLDAPNTVATLLFSRISIPTVTLLYHCALNSLCFIPIILISYSLGSDKMILRSDILALTLALIFPS